MASTSATTSTKLNITGLVSNTDWQNLATEISANQKTIAEQPLNTEKTKQQNILSTWQSFNTTLSAVTNYIDTNSLNKDKGYQSYSASLLSTDASITASSVVSASVGQGDISPGTYGIEVSALAAAEKVSSDTFASSTTALGFSGDIVLNNHTISIAATDTLNSIASKINSAGAGVTASVLNLSSTDHRLTLESKNQGAAGISIKDGDASNVLESLKLTSGSTLIHASGSNALSDTYAGAQLTHASGSNALSGSYADSSTAVGTLLNLGSPQSGSIQIQGTDSAWKSVSVNLATDSLQTIADNINAANVTGVTASVVPTTSNGTTTYKLQMTNVKAANLQDQNSVLATLDIFKSGATTAVGTFLGLSSPQSGSIQIQGTDSAWKSVSVNLATDSLQTIADNINAAGATGVTASVVPSTLDDGTTTYQLQLTNVSATNLQDQNNILATLGVAGGTAKNMVQEGKDAALKIDGYAVKATSNTVVGAISGVTLNLTGTNAGKPIELTITQDTSGVADKVNTLVKDLSSALSFITSQNTYDPKSTSATANILMGDASLSSIRSTIKNTLFETIPGNKTYTTAASIGITFGKDGTLSLDSDTFAAAMSANPSETMNAVKTLSSDLYNNLNLYVNPTTGTLTSLQASINTRMTHIDDQLKAVDDRCDKQAALLQTQFDNLQVLLSQSESTKSYLTSIIDSMKKSSS